MQIADNIRELALFNLAIDRKLRGGDLMRIRVKNISHGGSAANRAMILQSKTQQSVQFEITDQTGITIARLICNSTLRSHDYLFKTRFSSSKHLSTRQYARIVKSWVSSIGLDPGMYGTHTMRRTKASLIYRRTKNLRAVQLLLGHAKLESTVRYLGIEVDDALEMAEKTEV